MRPNKQLIVMILVAAAICLSCTGSDAAYNYRLTLKSPLPAVTGTIYVGQVPRWEAAYIGPVLVEVHDLNTQTSWLQRMLCIDLVNSIYVNQSWYANLNTGLPAGVASSTAWDKAVWIARNNGSWDDGTWSAANSAAIQLAVWEAISDPSFNLDPVNGGMFRLSGALRGTGGVTTQDVINIAQGFYESASAPTGYASGMQWYDAFGGQDTLFYGPPPPTPPVIPEIPAALLAPLGLAALGVIRRRLS